MKITKRQLRRIIREEKRKLVKETFVSHQGGGMHVRDEVRTMLADSAALSAENLQNDPVLPHLNNITIENILDEMRALLNSESNAEILGNL